MTVADPLRDQLRRVLTQRLLQEIPRVLALLDKNRLSTTYGSFDRKYWHYKILDFPCGMQQELALPLAYVWSQDFEGNRYYRNERVRAYLEAAFAWHARSVHADGSLDDYFPFERAYGATAYAVAALSDAVAMTGIENAACLAALERSATFLAGFTEQRPLSNHLAISAYALESLARLTDREQWHAASGRLIDRLEAVQNEEGWFPEYEGCDLGYQTVTVEFLARTYALTGERRLAAMLDRTVGFLHGFVHPDGTLGGEYGSRNTFNFYPGGFAVLSGETPRAGEILGGFLSGVLAGNDNKPADDGVFGHMLSTYVTVLRAEDLTVSPMPWDAADDGVVAYPRSGLFRGRAGAFRIYGSLTKGGVFRLYRDRALVHADTGLAGRLEDGRGFLQNRAHASQGTVEGGRITVSGRMQAFANNKMTPFKMIVLRALGLVFGRWQAYSHVIRRLLQNVLIVGRKELPIGFARSIDFSAAGVEIEDRLDVADGKMAPVAVYRTTDCVNTHVITSDSLQPGNLLSWQELDIQAGANPKTYTLTIGEAS